MNDPKSQEKRLNWLEERKSGIGGSDVACILGLSPWKSPLDVYLDKTGQSAPQVETEAMWWGTQLEDLVARKYCEVADKEVRNVNSILRSKEYPMLIGNIDRAVCPEKGKLPVVRGEFRTDTILECKTARMMGDDWGKEGTDEVPEYYLTQCLHYLGLTGCKYCDVAVFFKAENKFNIYRVQADNDVIKRMFEFVASWWNSYVVPRTPPPPRTQDEVKKLFMRSVSKEIVATADIEQEIRGLAMLKRQEKTIDAAIEKTKDTIGSFMKDNDTVVGLDGRALLTWKTGKDKSFINWEQVARSAGCSEAQILANTITTVGNRTMLNKVKL